MREQLVDQTKNSGKLNSRLDFFDSRCLNLKRTLEFQNLIESFQGEKRK